MVRGLLERPDETTATIEDPNTRKGRSTVSQTLPQVIRTIYLRPRQGDGRVPYGIAVNPATDLVYTANSATDNVTVLDAASADVVAVYGAGTQPSGVAIDSSSNFVYVANGPGGALTVLNGTNGTTVTQVSPFGVVFSNIAITMGVDEQRRRIYVPYALGEQMWVLDGKTNTVAALVDVGKGPVAAAVNPVTGVIYVTNKAGRSVSVVDAATNKVVQTLPVDGSPSGAAVDVDANLLYVADATSQKLLVFDGSQGNQQIASIALGAAPSEVAINPAARQVFVTLPQANTVAVVSTQNGYEVADVAIAGGPLGVAAHARSGKVFTAQSGASTVAVIRDNVVDRVIKIGSQPNSVAANPVTNRAYVVDDLGDLVDVIDGIDGRVITSIQVGSNASGVAVNTRANRIYVSNAFSSSVSVIDGASNQIVATVQLQGQVLPGALAVNEETNRIYAVNSQSSNVSVIDGRTNTQIGVIDVSSNGSLTSPLGIAVNPATNKIYVALYFGPGVAIADGNTNQANILPLSAIEPTSVAADSATNRIYVTSYFGVTTVIDGAADKVVTTANTGGGSGAAVNVPLNRFYTCNFSQNQLDVVDGAGATLLGAVQVGAGPWSVAVDATNNRIYTANLNDGTVTQLMEPGA